MRKTMLSAAALTILGAVLCSGVATTTAFAQAADAQAGEAKQVTLTQAQIDQLIAAQSDIGGAEGAVPQDNSDGAGNAKFAAAVKKHGFASVADFSNASYSVGLVMAGIDPDTQQYLGPAAVIGKQIKQVRADKTMSPKDKKAALDELNGALAESQAEKPLPANIDLVKTNYDKISKAMQQGK